jgi:hypothetical protein
VKAAALDEMQANKKGARKGAFFIVRYYQVCVLWHPVNPPALGLHVVPLKFKALLVVADAVASVKSVLSDVKWFTASFVVSWQTVQANPSPLTWVECCPE